MVFRMNERFRNFFESFCDYGPGCESDDHSAGYRGVRRFHYLSFVGVFWKLGVCATRENKPKLGSVCRFSIRKPSVRPSNSGM